MKVNEQQNNQPSTLRQAVGITTGAAIALAPGIRWIYKRGGIYEKAYTEKQLLYMQARTKEKYPEVDSFENIMKVANDIMKKTGLKKEGVEIKVWTPDMLKDIRKPSRFLNNQEEIRFIQNTNQKKMWAYGINASFYSPYKGKSGRINIPKQILSTAVFHEIGHALNYFKNGFLRFLQPHRNIFSKGHVYVGLIALAVGLIHNKKPDSNKKSGYQKTADFIHDNAGKLTFLVYSPILLEEAMASKKAAKLAKPYFTPLQHQQHVKNLTKALGRYIMKPLILSIPVALGIYVKDKIVNDKRTDL